MPKLSDSILTLTGLGEKSAQKLNNIGIYTIEHLLLHLPNRYQDKTKITSLQTAQTGEEVLVELIINRVEQIQLRQKQLLCYLVDEHNKTLLIRFFHFNQYQKQAFVRGDIIQCFGEIKIGRKSLEMLHPEYRLISKNQGALLEKKLSPVYPLTQGISQTQIKKWINIALKVLEQSDIIDYFKILTNNMPTLEQSLNILHHPKATENIEKIYAFEHIAQQRLIVEELCANQLSLLLLKNKRKNKASNVFIIKNRLVNKLLNFLEFELTSAQKRCVDEINTDISSSQPMLRLLQGDVGSGKTIVAVFACLQAVQNNFQTAIMAPTEILASQHLQSFSNYLEPLGIKIAFLTGSQKTATRTEQLEKIKTNDVHVVIGTHVLFQQNVKFNKLGLVIIDEQHKFGVHQRLSLMQKASVIPHQLVMSATPIPRSLAMSAYADLDTSTIDEMPPGRKSIKTIALPDIRKNKVVEKIKQVCKSKNQVYWVCTLIEESDALRAQSAQNTFEYLQKNLTGLTVVLIHGRIKKDEKTQIMNNFAKGEIDVLVATTVVEVGVNVINASLMVIENAERLGLAQLHQLRGRVGRGSQDSTCILIYQPPLGVNAAERINILRQTNDGFKIAQKDLELRGAGEILGTQQAGVVDMRIADIARDAYLLKQARYFADKFLILDEKAKQSLINRWINLGKIKYAKI